MKNTKHKTEVRHNSAYTSTKTKIIQNHCKILENEKALLQNQRWNAPFQIQRHSCLLAGTWKRKIWSAIQNSQRRHQNPSQTHHLHDSRRYPMQEVWD